MKKYFEGRVSFDIPPGFRQNRIRSKAGAEGFPTDPRVRLNPFGTSNDVDICKTEHPVAIYKHPVAQ